MAEGRPQSHWLNQYASNFHRWRSAHDEDGELYYRPLGFVEQAFDTDGIHFEGRSDVNASPTFEIRSTLSAQQLRDRILYTWAVLRLHHVLLLSRAVARQQYMSEDGAAGRDRFFVVRRPKSVEAALGDARDSLVFAGDHYDAIDPEEFCKDAQNCTRVVDESRALSRLFVLPLEQLSAGRFCLRVLVVSGHQITDGLTNVVWMVHFMRLLNGNVKDLKTSLSPLITDKSMRSRLPLPQEDLYPAIRGSRARQRWFWVLSIILRHVRKPLPAAFPNPLARPTRSTPRRFPSTFDRLLDYGKTPPLNTLTASLRVGAKATRRLHRICRDAKSSIGAGCFVLVAVVMMELYEAREPHVAPAERRPFIGSFPINPRPFFAHASAPDSLMLAFSDGVVLPFLPSSLPLDKRIRLLVRSAHRQLSQYQKRERPAGEDAKTFMGSRGPGRVIAMNYIAAVERADTKLPPHLRRGIDPQGAYPVRPNAGLATCGVSSVGRNHPDLRPGRYNLDGLLGQGEDAFVADFMEMKQNVRARDGEFLVGISGDEDKVFVNVSYDASTIDEKMVEHWKEKMEEILLEGGGTNL